MKLSFAPARQIRWLALGLLSFGLLAAGGARADGGAPLAPTPSQQPASLSLEQRIAAYLAHRPGAVTVAVDDVDAQKLWLYGPTMRNYTASIIKVDILEARLYQTRGHLSSYERSLAVAMIERSDNNAATALWKADRAAAGLGAYNRRAGLRCTSFDPLGHWGLTLTCARDQLRLLDELAEPDSLLSASSRRYELSLMEHIISAQAWGVSGGVPLTGVTVALKNGWLPHGNAPWVVNSIGIVQGDGRRYFIAVLTRDPTEQEGITTIEDVSGIVWQNISQQPETAAAVSG
jgi:hypothetical protein